jgi:hypothetical protein
MSDQQLYFAIGVPVFAVFMGMLLNGATILWQSRNLDRTFSERFKSVDQRFTSIEGRLDRIERTLEVIQTDLKQFYKDIAQLKARTGLE